MGVKFLCHFLFLLRRAFHRPFTRQRVVTLRTNVNGHRHPSRHRRRMEGTFNGYHLAIRHPYHVGVSRQVINSVSKVKCITRGLTCNDKTFTHCPTSHSRQSSGQRGTSSTRDLMGPIRPVPILPASAKHKGRNSCRRTTPPGDVLTNTCRPTGPKRRRSTGRKMRRPSRSRMLLFPIRDPSTRSITNEYNGTTICHRTHHCHRRSDRYHLTRLTSRRNMRCITSMFMMGQPYQPIRQIRFRPSPSIPLRQRERWHAARRRSRRRHANKRTLRYQVAKNVLGPGRHNSRSAPRSRREL